MLVVSGLWRRERHFILAKVDLSLHVEEVDEGDDFTRRVTPSGVVVNGEGHLTGFPDRWPRFAHSRVEMPAFPLEARVGAVRRPLNWNPSPRTE